MSSCGCEGCSRWNQCNSSMNTCPKGAHICHKFKGRQTNTKCYNCQSVAAGHVTGIHFQKCTVSTLSRYFPCPCPPTPLQGTAVGYTGCPTLLPGTSRWSCILNYIPGNDVSEVGWQEPSPSCKGAWTSARAFCAANGGLYTIQVQAAVIVAM